MKFIVWVKDEDTRGNWVPNGDGPMSEKTAERIKNELRRAGYPALAMAVGHSPVGED